MTAAGPSDERWIESLVEASAARQGLSSTVALSVDKSDPSAFRIEGGRVVATAEPAAAEVTIPLTAAQLRSILDGSESLAQAFMRGDVKPEGSTGALLAAIELFEDATFRQQLAERT
jgi:putative sterol carrier protein